MGNNILDGVVSTVSSTCRDVIPGLSAQTHEDIDAQTSRKYFVTGQARGDSVTSVYENSRGSSDLFLNTRLYIRCLLD